MTMHNCPALTAVVVQQRHQDLRHEATQWHAARGADSRPTRRARAGPGRSSRLWPPACTPVRRTGCPPPPDAWRSGFRHGERRQRERDATDEPGRRDPRPASPRKHRIDTRDEHFWEDTMDAKLAAEAETLYQTATRLQRVGLVVDRRALSPAQRRAAFARQCLAARCPD